VAGRDAETSVRIAAVGIVIRVAIAAPVVIEAITGAGRETPAATEMPFVAEDAARPSKVLTRKAAAESHARTA
jgi:hypothetical protein